MSRRAIVLAIVGVLAVGAYVAMVASGFERDQPREQSIEAPVFIADAG